MENCSVTIQLKDGTQKRVRVKGKDLFDIAVAGDIAFDLHKKFNYEITIKNEDSGDIIWKCLTI